MPSELTVRYDGAIPRELRAAVAQSRQRNMRVSWQSRQFSSCGRSNVEQQRGSWTLQEGAELKGGDNRDPGSRDEVGIWMGNLVRHSADSVGNSLPYERSESGLEPPPRERAI
jgi:hypothetical protein